MRFREMVAAVALAVPAAAVLAQPAPDAAAYAALAKLPEIAGLWEITFGGGPRGAPAEGPSLTPAYAAKLKSYQDAQKRGEIQDSPAANCVPPGMPGVMTQPYPIEILLTPGKITIIAEAYSQWRQIFTDGRKHPDDPDLTYNGHSIGHWEGDTLVVDTVGFTTDTALGNFGLRHSDKMRIVERFRLAAPDRLEIETTITDPEALTKPWTTTRAYGRHRDWTLAEYVCQQNNRNFTTEEGKAGINLQYEVKK
ncbi:MAG TPA: hypothetical protein VHH11_09650 [Gammaproteobacteria bacterium]|jgi:hypothetical protein|nr:hypothetical protein [Gammaproteobacteria bacterium]